MTLADNLLESLSVPRSPTEGRHTHAHSVGDWSVSVTADRADSVGSLLWDLTVARSAVGVPNRPVGPWASRAAARVTGLLEPLKVIEVDVERDEAILRSTAPAKKGDLANYYELHLAGTGVASLRRFTADTAAGTRREQVSFALTHEVIAKLADDLIRD